MQIVLIQCSKQASILCGSTGLLRYFAQDDLRQSAQATRLIETRLSAARPGFVSLVVLVELCWVLKRLFAMPASDRSESSQNCWPHGSCTSSGATW